MEFLLSTQGNPLVPLITTDEVITVLTGIFLYAGSDLFVKKLLQNWTRFESLVTSYSQKNNLSCVATMFQLLGMVSSPHFYPNE